MLPDLDLASEKVAEFTGKTLDAGCTPYHSLPVGEIQHNGESKVTLKTERTNHMTPDCLKRKGV